MKIAAISDIHGNIDALTAVLADIDREGVAMTSRRWRGWQRDRPDWAKPLRTGRVG